MTIKIIDLRDQNPWTRFHHALCNSILLPFKLLPMFYMRYFHSKIAEELVLTNDVGWSWSQRYNMGKEISWINGVHSVADFPADSFCFIWLFFSYNMSYSCYTLHFLSYSIRIYSLQGVLIIPKKFQEFHHLCNNEWFTQEFCEASTISKHCKNRNERKNVTN